MQTSVLLVGDDTQQASRLHQAIQAQRPNWTVHRQSAQADPVRFLAETQVDVIVESQNEPQPSRWLDKCKALYPFCIGLSADSAAGETDSLVSQIEQSCGIQSHLHDPDLQAMTAEITDPQSLTDEAKSRFKAEPLPGFCVETYFEHARSVGRLAESIASVIQVPGRMDLLEIANHALVAGTLHDVGKLVLAIHRREEFAEALSLAEQTAKPLWQAEVAVLGTTHAAVGAHLLCSWGYPRSLVDGVALHHQPSLCSDTQCAVLIAVHVANAMQAISEARSPDTKYRAFGPMGTPSPDWDEDFLDNVGMLDRVRGWADRIRQFD